MPLAVKTLHPAAAEMLRKGCVIPAHPLALDNSRKLDRKHQRALTRYYVEAGAGGVAVGVHTTQFAIRKAGLLEAVLRLASETVDEYGPREPFVKVAGICGPTDQAVREAEMASELGYDLALVSPVGVEGMREEELLERTWAVAEVIPVFGFYLQPAVGGRVLSANFWRRLADIPAVAAIKIAPFNRYRTLEVVKAVSASRRGYEIALYTGNDDNIVFDLVTPFRFVLNGRTVTKRIVGGLLGQWAVWTKSAVSLLDEIKRVTQGSAESNIIPADILRLGVELTDANAAIFDAANNFRGSIPGIHEVLRRQGLMQNRLTLDPLEDLSPGQQNEIDRVLANYPHLHEVDDKFVKDRLNDWLS